MDIPVDLRLARELRVGIGSEARRDIWRDDAVDEIIEAEGGEDLVSVVGERLKSERSGNGFGGFYEEVRWREERIAHFDVEPKN